MKKTEEIKKGVQDRNSTYKLESPRGECNATQ